MIWWWDEVGMIAVGRGWDDGDRTRLRWWWWDEVGTMVVERDWDDCDGTRLR